jgi:hypothetical protein
MSLLLLEEKLVLQMPRYAELAKGESWVQGGGLRAGVLGSERSVFNFLLYEH